MIALFLTSFAPLAERLDAAIDRLHAIPRLLAEGQAAVRSAPAAWTDRALRECGGLLALLAGGTEQLIRGEGIAQVCGVAVAGHFRAAAASAAHAVATYQVFLGDQLRPRATDEYGCGAAAFDLYMRQGHCLDRPLQRDR